MEQMPKLPISPRRNSHVPPNPNRTHTLPDSVYHEPVISIMSHRLVSCPLWKPLAPNGRAEGRFNFIKLPCRLEVSLLQGTPSSTAAECLSPLPLFILDQHVTRGQEGSPTVAMAPGIQCAGVSPPLSVYVMDLSVSPSPSLLADHKRHRNAVAKYLGSSTCLMVDLTTGKAQRKQGSAQHSLKPYCSRIWVAHACPKGLGETLRWAH